MLAVCSICEEKSMEVKGGRRDIYSRVSAISWFNIFSRLMNTKLPGLHLAQPPGTSEMRSLEMKSSTCGDESS